MGGRDGVWMAARLDLAAASEVKRTEPKRDPKYISKMTSSGVFGFRPLPRGLARPDEPFHRSPSSNSTRLPLKHHVRRQSLTSSPHILSLSLTFHSLSTSNPPKPRSLPCTATPPAAASARPTSSRTCPRRLAARASPGPNSQRKRPKKRLSRLGRTSRESVEPTRSRRVRLYQSTLSDLA